MKYNNINKTQIEIGQNKKKDKNPKDSIGNKYRNRSKLVDNSNIT